jgi:cytochrome d ubiquinol oxidase subunit I
MLTLLASDTVNLRAHSSRRRRCTTSFVPLTLGLGPIVATFQTLWHRTGDENWLRLTRFFGTLFLINFAIGVATGLVQEFQLEMNWSVYSRFVGNVFGAPLCRRGPRGVLPRGDVHRPGSSAGTGSSPRLHLATIWIVGWDVDVGVLHPRGELVDAIRSATRS